MTDHQKLDTSKMSVEHKPSETAMGAATLRALAALDQREEIRGPDYLAQIFLTEDRKSALRDPFIRESVIKKRIIPGMYEFLIARTAFFDDIVEQALRENVPQIVFMGAGYDSRPYRFKDIIKDTRIFELDSQPTQERKRELLKKAEIPIPKQVVFVSINFNTDDLGDVLSKAGFIKSKQVLFVWEGVTYYLSAEVIDDTLSTVKMNSPVGSSVCFDYASLSPALLNDHSVQKLREMMKSNYPGEPTNFGIQEGNIGSFLLQRGYKIIAHLAHNEIERKYLSLNDGSSVGKLLALFCFVHALVSD
jgi:methyltransferase (TIGR00027 family)